MEAGSVVRLGHSARSPLLVVNLYTHNEYTESDETTVATDVAIRKNLINLGHDLGNRDQDKVDPGQESRFLARMAKILLINFFTLLVKRNPTAIAI